VSSVDKRSCRCRPPRTKEVAVALLRAPPRSPRTKEVAVAVLRAPPCPPWTKEVAVALLRAPPRPPRTKEVAAAVLRAPPRPPRTKEVTVAVLRAPPRPPLTKEVAVLRAPPCPPWTKEVAVAVLRAPPRPPRPKEVAVAVLRAPPRTPWTKDVAVLRAPPRPPRTKEVAVAVLRAPPCPPWTSSSSPKSSPSRNPSPANCCSLAIGHQLYSYGIVWSNNDRANMGPGMRIGELLWPQDRIDHIARHGITTDEVEEVCFGRPLVQRAKSQGQNPVYYILGQTDAGRSLFCVAIRFPGGRGLPVTARPMTGRERRRYRQWRNR